MSIIVAGIGRCGLSLTMQMLDAAGVPVVGDFPAYEVASRYEGNTRAVVAAHPGRAVKLVDPDPSFAELAGLPVRRAIVLDRDPTEQAKSQCKLLGIAATPNHVRRLSDSMAKDQPKLAAGLGLLGVPTLRVRFEDLVGDPAGTAERFAAFVGGLFDTRAAVSAAKPRGPACLPYMLELELIAGRAG